MKNKIAFLLCFSISWATSQGNEASETSTTVPRILKRFDEITGVEIDNSKMTVESMKEDINKLMMANKRLTDSLKHSEDQITALYYDNLVAKYSNDNQNVKYDKTQYDDFKKNVYLQKLIQEKNVLSFFFANNSSDADFGLYSELVEIQKACIAAKRYRITINASADATGDDHTNQLLIKARAEKLKKYLVETLNLDPALIVVNSNGESINKITIKELDFLNRRAVLTYTLMD